MPSFTGNIHWSGRAAPVTIQEEPWEVLTNSDGSWGLLLLITHLEHHRVWCAATGHPFRHILLLPGTPLQILLLLLKYLDQNLAAIESKAIVLAYLVPPSQSRWLFNDWLVACADVVQIVNPQLLCGKVQWGRRGVLVHLQESSWTRDGEQILFLCSTTCSTKISFYKTRGQFR